MLGSGNLYKKKLPQFRMLVFIDHRQACPQLTQTLASTVSPLFLGCFPKIHPVDFDPQRNALVGASGIWVPAGGMILYQLAPFQSGLHAGELTLSHRIDPPAVAFLVSSSRIS